MNRSGSASGGYSSGLEAAYHNYGMDMESWKSDKYSQGRYKVGGLFWSDCSPVRSDV